MVVVIEVEAGLHQGEVGPAGGVGLVHEVRYSRHQMSWLQLRIVLDANIPHSITGGRGGFSGPTGPPDSVFGTYIFPCFSLRQVSIRVLGKEKERKN